MQRVSTKWWRGMPLWALCGLGCYKTVVRAPQDQFGSPMYEDRQWFAAAGMVQLSAEPGDQCTAGFSAVESRTAVVDVLIHAGLAVAGAVVGAVACPLDAGASDRDKVVFAACVAGLSAGFPLAVSSRTISYHCNDPRVARGRGVTPFVAQRTQ